MARQSVKEAAIAITKQMNQITKHKSLMLSSELGVINDRRELKLDSFKHAFTDYLAADDLVLSPGDRVIATPVNKGNDYVIVAKVKKHG